VGEGHDDLLLLRRPGRGQLQPRAERTLDLSDRLLALGAGGQVDHGVQIDHHADGERVREEREGHAEELERLGGEHRRVVGDLADDGLSVHHGVGCPLGAARQQSAARQIDR